MHDNKYKQWYGASIDLFTHATCHVVNKKSLMLAIFFWNFYEVEKKGTGHVMGNLEE